MRNATIAAWRKWLNVLDYNMEIIPSILTTTENEFTEQLAAMNLAPINAVHIDITDGIFVPKQTFTSPEITQNILQQSGCELHLMVADPLAVLPLWAEVPNVIRVLFHYETGVDVTKVAEAIHEQGWEAGLVLNPETPIDVIEPLLEHLDTVMFMGVIPGSQGQTLIPQVLEKAYTCRQKYPDLYLEWDGDVTEETLPHIINTGVDAVCPGHAVFGAGDPVENIVKLQNLI